MSKERIANDQDVSAECLSTAQDLSPEAPSNSQEVLNGHGAGKESRESTSDVVSIQFSNTQYSLVQQPTDDQGVSVEYSSDNEDDSLYDQRVSVENSADNEDGLLAYNPTLGFFRTLVDADGLYYEAVDVGGARSERTK